MKHLRKWQRQHKEQQQRTAPMKFYELCTRLRGRVLGDKGCLLNLGGSVQWWRTALSAPKSAGLLTCTWEKWEPI